jgi:hypothetical protein
MGVGHILRFERFVRRRPVQKECPNREFDCPWHKTARENCHLGTMPLQALLKQQSQNTINIYHFFFTMSNSTFFLANV